MGFITIKLTNHVDEYVLYVLDLFVPSIMAGFHVQASYLRYIPPDFNAAIQVATAPFVAPNASSLVKTADLGKVGLAEGIKFGIKFLDSLIFLVFFRKKYNDD